MTRRQAKKLVLAYTRTRQRPNQVLSPQEQQARKLAVGKWSPFGTMRKPRYIVFPLFTCPPTQFPLVASMTVQDMSLFSYDTTTDFESMFKHFQGLLP